MTSSSDGRWSRRAFLAALIGATSGGVALARSDGPSGETATCSTGDPTRYGVNADAAADVAARLAAFGAVGITRVFYPGMLPAHWVPTSEGASPDRATQVSFKAPPAEVASGVHDELLRSWLVSIPSGWRVYLTFWHEPNDELRDGGFSTADFRAAWSRLSALCAEVAVQPGVVLSLVPVFMSYQVDTETGWSDAWVPSPEEVACLSWDVYGNPTDGAGLAGPYPDVTASLDPCLLVTARLGFTTWAVTEFNTPRRTWDVTESGRTAWLERFRQYAIGCGRQVAPELGAPQLMLLWEGRGANWDQRFRTVTTRDWWQNVISPSPV